MRRLLIAGAVIAVVIAVFTIGRTRREVPEPTPAEAVVPAPLPARIVEATVPPPAPPDRTLRPTAPVVVRREPSVPNEERITALHQVVMTTTPDAARLYADFAKAGVTTPPQAQTLIQMKQRGTPHDDLVAYVNSTFPNDLIARAVALRWLGTGSAAHRPPDTKPLRPLGELVKRDAN